MFRSLISLTLQTATPKRTHAQVNKKQNQALLSFMWHLRSAPTYAVITDASVESLDIRIEKAATMGKCNSRLNIQNRKEVDKWKYDGTLKLKTPLLMVNQLNAEHQLPKERKSLEKVKHSPNTNLPTLDSTVN